MDREKARQFLIDKKIVLIGAPDLEHVTDALFFTANSAGITVEQLTNLICPEDSFSKIRNIEDLRKELILIKPLKLAPKPEKRSWKRPYKYHK